MSRIVGIDFGLKRIGMAISDPQQIIASSLSTLATRQPILTCAQDILDAIKTYSVEKIVLGNPLYLNGSASFLSDEVQRLATALSQRTNILIVLWDERLSTKQAERSLLESSLSRKKRASKIDSITAIILLQSYLDCLSITREQQIESSSSLE